MRKNYKNRLVGLVLLTFLFVCVGCGNQKTTEQQADSLITTEQTKDKVQQEDQMIPEELPEEALGEQEGEATFSENLFPEDETENETMLEEQNSQNQTSAKNEDDEGSGVIFEKSEGAHMDISAPRLDFPVEIEDGKLMIESVFQYSGLNLDAKDTNCENIGAVQLKNISTQYLDSADVVVTLSDGTELNFFIEDIPVGKSVIAFEIENDVYDVSQSVEQMTAEIAWGTNISMLEDKVSVSADEMELIVKNLSGSTLENLKVAYHCELDGMFFGGKSYKGSIAELKSGESAAINASECYLGEAVVVRVGE